MHNLCTSPKQDAHLKHKSEPQQHRDVYEQGCRRLLDLELTMCCISHHRPPSSPSSFARLSPFFLLWSSNLFPFHDSKSSIRSPSTLLPVLHHCITSSNCLRMLARLVIQHVGNALYRRFHHRQ